MGKVAESGGAALVPPRDAAFVVHLTGVAEGSGDDASGRVEHVRTGRSTRFESAEELLRFMRQTLAALDAESGR